MTEEMGGTSRLREHVEKPLPGRFYKTVAITPERGLALDGRPVRTPSKQLLTLPTRNLAEAVAKEWSDQETVINPATMILTKLANTAIDRVLPERGRIIEEIAAYAGSDLVCYRAEEPAELRARQGEVWDPILTWALKHLDARFEQATGVMHRPQPREALDAFRHHISRFDHWRLAALHNITTMTGSAIIAAMLAVNEIEPDAAWAAAHVDEDWQIAHWGEDHEAKTRSERRRGEFQKTAEFLALLRE